MEKFNSLYYFNGPKIREEIMDGQNGANRVLAKIMTELEKLDNRGTAKATFFETIESELQKLKTV